MRFGLDVAQQRMTWDELVSRVRFAEDLGFDGAWGFDHFQPMYGDGPGETFEGMTTLAALAGVTSRIRLGLLVTGVTYRHPSVLAAQALTIDHASHGRLDLSLGAAWFDQEHTALGIPFPTTGARFDLLEDALEIVTRLFTGEVVSYDGKRMSLHDAQMRPPPVQLATPAHLDRRHRPDAHPAPGRPLRRRLARLRHAQLVGGGLGPHRPAGRRGRPEPTDITAGRLALARRPRPPRPRTPPSGATPATTTWCAAGRATAATRSSASPETSCPSSPTPARTRTRRRGAGTARCRRAASAARRGSGRPAAPTRPRRAGAGTPRR